MSTDEEELAAAGFERVHKLAPGSIYRGLPTRYGVPERWIVTDRGTVVSLENGQEFKIGSTMLTNQIERRGENR